MKKKLAALPYYGGKSPYRNTGPWIASMLPMMLGYVEPFAGMLGVLLQRKPSQVEMVNDRCRHLTNWWTVVRDHPKKLEKLLKLTPRGKDIYGDAFDRLNSGEPYADPVRWALDYHVVIDQGMMHGVSHKGWGAAFNYNDAGTNARVNSKHPGTIPALSKRMINVQIHNTDACKIMEKTTNKEAMVVYCDPPYIDSSDCRPYGETDFDKDAFGRIVKGAKAFVAISGYPGDWDHLGWHRYERKVHLGGQTYGGKRAKRTEVLWTNKPAAGVPKRSLL